MTARKLAVGAAIEAWCTKCKEDRAHTVETVKADGTPGKARCNFCSGSHLYRAPKLGAPAAKPEKKASSAKSGGAAPKRRSKAADAVVTETEMGRAKPYAMDREFAVGEVIDHSKFGYGRVMALKAGGKMDVIFDGTPRILVCKDMGSLLLRRSPRAVARPVPEVEEVEADEVEAEVPAGIADPAEEE